MFISPNSSRANSLTRLLFIILTGTLAMMMMVFGPVLWLLTMLAGGAAGLATLACVAATIGVALGPRRRSIYWHGCTRQPYSLPRSRCSSFARRSPTSRCGLPNNASAVSTRPQWNV